MKKSVYLLLMMAFILGACSKDNKNEMEPPVEEPEPESLLESWLNEYFGNLDWDLTPYPFLEDWDLTPYLNVCDSVTDAVILDVPQDWKIGQDMWIIEDDTVRSMSACGLLETMMLHRRNLSTFPFPISSNHMIPGSANFNQDLWINKVAVEFFAREDCIFVLVSKYLSITAAIMDGYDSYTYTMRLVLEMLMASDMCMSVLSEEEKSLFIAMGLERAKYTEDVHGTCQMMIAIMKSCNYTLFMEEVWPKLVDSSRGYTFSPFIMKSVGFWSLGITGVQADVIVQYALQFYKQTKTEIL